MTDPTSRRATVQLTPAAAAQRDEELAVLREEFEAFKALPFTNRLINFLFSEIPSIERQLLAVPPHEEALRLNERLEIREGIAHGSIATSVYNFERRRINARYIREERERRALLRAHEESNLHGGVNRRSSLA